MANLIEHDRLNKETPPKALLSSFLTPQSIFYQRNHGDFLSLDPNTHVVTFETHPNLPQLKNSFSLSIADINALQREDVVVALQCAGNRRSEMNSRHETEGIQWQNTAIGNAMFSGALLSSLLSRLGVTDNFAEDKTLRNGHVEFISDQPVSDDTQYAASIPLSVAMNEAQRVLLATHINGETLNKAHGGPVRVIVPGHIGARSVKWLSRVVLRADESPNFYQQNDYKVLPPDVTSETKVDALTSTAALQEFDINSAILEPSSGATVQSPFKVKGYALSGGHAHINKVEVLLLQEHEDAALEAQASVDWIEASLETSHHPFAWVLFEAEVRADVGIDYSLVARASCTDGSQQAMRASWNLRGVNETSYPVVRNLRVVA